MRIEQANLKVLHVIYSGLGGHGAVTISLIQAGLLAEAKHHVVLAGIEPPLNKYIEILEGLGVSWSYVAKPPKRGHLTFYRSLREEFHKRDPDVIFLNGVAAVPATFAPWPMKRQKPMILVRDSEPVQLKTPYEWLLLALAHIMADQLVFLTPEAAQSARARLRCVSTRGKGTIIPNGLDTQFYHPRHRAKPNGTFNIGMVSRLQHKKDHLTLLAAFDRICEVRSDLNVKLHIAGDGATRSQIEEEINRRRLNDKVVMHGLLDSLGVRDLLARLDLYVHATFGETMSNSILQAMAMGLPILASDVEGVSNIIGKQVGRLYPSQDEKALADDILRWIDKPRDAEAFGERARVLTETKYDSRIVAAKYQSIILDHLI